MNPILKSTILVSGVLALACGCARQPEGSPFDAVVAQDGSGDYTTVQAAIAAAPDSLTARGSYS